MSRGQDCEYVSHTHEEYERRSEEISRPPSYATEESAQELYGIMELTPEPNMSVDHTPLISDPGLISEQRDQVRHHGGEISPADREPIPLDDLAISLQKDLYLFDHYWDHSCRGLESAPDTGYARRIGLPRLATEDRGILCSLMAFGAACLCLDFLLGEENDHEIDNVEELIRTADRYHQIGLESIQAKVALNQRKQTGEAHAHSILLFPYALARQRITKLLKNLDFPITSNSVIENAGSLDWTILLRGISTIGRAYWAVEPHRRDGTLSGFRNNHLQSTPPTISTHILARISSEPKSPQQLVDPIVASNALASKHPLFPVVSATRVVALNNLQRKVDDMDRRVRTHHRKNAPNMDGTQVSLRVAHTHSLTACSIAVDLLVDLGKILFNLEQSDTPLDPYANSSAANSSNPSTTSSPPQLEDSSSLWWLRDYAKRGAYDHTVPALRTVFAWVPTTPDEYFDLLKESLSPKSSLLDLSFRDIDRELRLLAWDIWAHWSVFSILIENEAFWTAELGMDSIKGLMPVFLPTGERADGREEEGGDWWPGNMYAVAGQLKKYQHGGLDRGR